MAPIHGGKTIHGAALGILMLNTRFPRIPGDIGNALTWPFPVQYRIVEAANPENVVLNDPAALLPDFIAAGRALVQAGCDGVATNCGFLVPFQNALSEALGVPVASSSLMQVPSVAAMLPAERRVGVVTISAETLEPRHLEAAGIGPETPIEGIVQNGHFGSGILYNTEEIDFSAAGQEVIDAAARLVAKSPDVGAIVLECTNMVPYAAAIRRATGRPVFSIYTYLTWFQAALLPRRFPPDLDDPRY